MPYANLSQCVDDLEAHGHLKRIDYPFDPVLELAAIQRRAFQCKAPALLFTNIKGCRFPMLANLFGSMERLEFLFRHTIEKIELLFSAQHGAAQFFRQPLDAAASLFNLRNAITVSWPTLLKKSPVLECECRLSDLPQLVSWPGDGGAFITLPLVHSQDPDSPRSINLGMYRIQISGNQYRQDEAGMHYQLHRGIGVHHAHAIAKGIDLPVNIYVGGPPALTVAAVMPLPAGMNEFRFAGILGGAMPGFVKDRDNPLPVFAEADFCISGNLTEKVKPEGPFGDHLGYYSLRHDFPVLQIKKISHRKNAIWPFTSVGRPPQEDTVFGDFIHKLTGPLVPRVFSGIHEVHAVDAAGVHPLLLALGSERYTAYEAKRKPRELLTQGMHLLGNTQTALAKFLFILAKEDVPGLSCRDVPAFFGSILERTNFERDLHFITASTNDTLDYSGNSLHEGSKLIWACAGEKVRKLGNELHDFPDLPNNFGSVKIVLPGILLLQASRHNMPRGRQDPQLDKLGDNFKAWPGRANFPLMVIVDDADFCARTLENFLWVTFTRADPATDSYGCNAGINAKHWHCEVPFVLDARHKNFHPDSLEDDPSVIARLEKLALRGQPLHGLI